MGDDRGGADVARAPVPGCSSHRSRDRTGTWTRCDGCAARSPRGP